MAEHLIIAIDGPAGAGKTTLGRMLARELGLLYIDTGSMYRAVALAVIESGTNESDDVTVGVLAERIDIDLAGAPDSLHVTLDGHDVTMRIRAEERQIDPAKTYEETLADMTERDARDSTRVDSPLVAAPDAVVLDTTSVSIDEVLRQMMREIETRS